MSILQVFANTGDDDISKSNNTYNTAHDATSGTVGTGQETINCVHQYVNPTYYIYRTFITFNTSALGVGASISDAKLYWYARNDAGYVDTDSDSITIVQSTQAGTTLGANDFDNVGTTNFITPLDWTSISLANYNASTLNASGISNISLTSNSLFAWRASKDVSRTAPGARSKVSISSTETAGTDQDPYIYITYTPGTSIKTLGGLAKASVKTVGGLAIASVKSIGGLQ
jgi:hypothetical protein